MPCYKPLRGFGKLGGGICFSAAGSNQVPLTVPCGQCIGCRIDRQKEWATRLCHEMKSHERSCFVTLTYAPEHLPRGATLVKRHVQLFIKSLRKKIQPKRIRYFACGEYGPQDLRPHYHLLIFGWEPSDNKVHTRNQNYTTYTSDTLATLWTYGYHTWSAASPENASYVSHYTTKKITGDMAKEHYTRITQDGEMIEVQPEFALMSSRPGIGYNHYKNYESDFRNSDTAIHLGKKLKVPRYYDKIYEREAAQALAAIKDQRKQKARKHRANNTPERLAVREKVQYAKLSFNQQRKSL